MLYIANIASNNSDYMPQIIGIMGTILGTILGWVLHLISDNIGRTYIFVDRFSELRSYQNEYACIVKLFIYNASYKQQCIRNMRLSFRNCSGKVLLECIPCEGECSFDIVRTKNDDKKNINMVSVSGSAQKEIFLSKLIDGEGYGKLLSAKKIFLLYEDKKNHKKRKLIKSNFCLNSVEKFKGEKFL